MVIEMTHNWFGNFIWTLFFLWLTGFHPWATSFLCRSGFNQMNQNRVIQSSITISAVWTLKHFVYCNTVFPCMPNSEIFQLKSICAAQTETNQQKFQYLCMRLCARNIALASIHGKNQFTVLVSRTKADI